MKWLPRELISAFLKNSEKCSQKWLNSNQWRGEIFTRSKDWVRQKKVGRNTLTKFIFEVCNSGLAVPSVKYREIDLKSNVPFCHGLCIRQHSYAWTVFITTTHVTAYRIELTFQSMLLSSCFSEFESICPFKKANDISSMPNHNWVDCGPSILR